MVGASGREFRECLVLSQALRLASRYLSRPCHWIQDTKIVDARDKTGRATRPISGRKNCGQQIGRHAFKPLSCFLQVENNTTGLAIEALWPVYAQRYFICRAEPLLALLDDRYFISLWAKMIQEDRQRMRLPTAQDPMCVCVD